ncbi:MAG: pyrimidine 5'-nucleotidase [Sphingomonadales bacterium]|nr:pyrimidine 5'-nucleotidase [Sphingomonadales bacterium]
MDAALSHVDCWIFDLDNTLYHPRHRLFDQIDRRMEAFVVRATGCEADQARGIQKGYFHEYGTTLSGLMRHHDIDPADYLAFVHDIVLDCIAPDPGLAAALAALPGRRIVFTNADAPHARRVLDRIGIGAQFEAIHDIVATGYVPKPADGAYRSLCDSLAIDPARAVLVEDMARNLAPAHALGMTTVWIDNGSEAGDRGHDPAFVDIHVDDLLAWLQGITHHRIASNEGSPA